MAVQLLIYHHQRHRPVLEQHLALEAELEAAKALQAVMEPQAVEEPQAVQLMEEEPTEEVLSAQSEVALLWQHHEHCDAVQR